MKIEMLRLTEGFELEEVNPPGLLVQLYVCPATAVAPTVVDDPLQMVDTEPTPGVGRGFTVTLTESVLEQPVAVIVSVNL